MHINELTDVVLARVLYWACDDPDCLSSKAYKLKTWRTKLALLSVCRVWRELALPNVHMTSFVGCIHIKFNNRHGSSIPSYADYEDMASEVETYIVKTNLDIIEKKDGKYWPKTVQIFVKTSCDPVHSLQGVIEKIRCHAGLLKNVRRVEPICDLRFRGDAWTDKPTSIAEASLIGEELSQLIPSAKFIEWINFTSAPPVMMGFAKSLIKGYAHQLTGFNYPQLALEDVPSFSNNLRLVEVNGYYCIMDYMPQICAENLIYLDLSFISSEFDWSSFESNDSPRCLNFANLKWLQLKVEVTYDMVNEVTNNWEYSASKFNYKVIAPKLETIHIRLCPFTLSFLSSIHGSTTIRDVELETEWALLNFTGFNLDKARELFARYAKSSQEEYQTVGKYAHMNDVLEIHNLAEYTKARVGFDGIPLNIVQVDWRYLQDIEMVCPVHVNNLKALISRMPNLEKIHIHILKLKVYGKLISEIQDEESIVKPISLSLKHISVGDIPGCKKNEMDKLNMYLEKLFPDSQVLLN